MCLTPIQNKASIAKKDIYTFKRLKMVRDKNGIILKAPYQSHFHYNLNHLYKEVKLKIKKGFNNSIYEGYHSYYKETKPTERYFINFNSYYFDKGDECIVLCKIPKGSKYFLGENNDIVSNQIILEKIIFEPKSITPKQNRLGIKRFSSITKHAHNYLKENYPNNII